jgi:hypothetical protein
MALPMVITTLSTRGEQSRRYRVQFCPAGRQPCIPPVRASHLVHLHYRRFPGVSSRGWTDLGHSNCSQSVDRQASKYLIVVSSRAGSSLVVNGTPQIHPLAGDPHHHLVEVPAIARPWTAPAQPSRDQRSEFQHPTPDGFVRDVEPARSARSSSTLGSSR